MRLVEKTRVLHKVRMTVKDVAERFQRDHVRGAGQNAEFTERSLGWFVVLEGWPSALGLGTEKPELAKGDKIILTLEKETT